MKSFFVGIFLGNIWKEKLYKIKLNTLKYHQIQFFSTLLSA